MQWEEPKYSKSQVDKAGEKIRRLRGSDDDGLDEKTLEEAIEVIWNWRTSHGFPIEFLRTVLPHCIKTFDPDGLESFRLKRLKSIYRKLCRNPRMRLSAMQDIAGARAVLGSVSQVRELEKYLRTEARSLNFDITDDYIAAPKASGYRSLHLINRISREGNFPFRGMSMEIQIRSRFQHAWATALETTEAFTKEALKSSEGDEEWLDFFRLMGSVIALKEDSNPVSDTPTGQDLYRSLTESENQLGVLNRFKAWKTVIDTTKARSELHEYFLLNFNLNAKTTYVTGYKKDELDLANRNYQELEHTAKAEGSDVVLVSVEKLQELQQAYPNYFADTDLFTSLVEEAMKFI